MIAVKPTAKDPKDSGVQPRSLPLMHLPILAPFFTPRTQSSVVEEKRPAVPSDNLDWLDIGFVSIRDANGRLVGSAGDVQAVMNEYRAKGTPISADEVTTIACQRLTKEKDE